MSAARQKVTSLEAALNVLVGHSGPEVDAKGSSPESQGSCTGTTSHRAVARVQGDPNATRESANVHRRLASEVESGAGIESEADPEDIAVEVEPARPAAVRAALLALDEIQSGQR